MKNIRLKNWHLEEFICKSSCYLLTDIIDVVIDVVVVVVDDDDDDNDDIVVSIVVFVDVVITK